MRETGTLACLSGTASECLFHVYYLAKLTLYNTITEQNAVEYTSQRRAIVSLVTVLYNYR